MNGVASRVVLPGPGESERAAPVFTRIQERLTANPQPPPALVGDLLLGLMRFRPSVREDERSPVYSDFMRQLTRSRRWSFLVGRLAQLGRNPRSAGSWLEVSAFVVESLLTSLWKISASAIEGETNHEALLTKAVEAYCAEADEYEDFSTLLLNDFAIAVTELIRRAFTIEYQYQLLHKALIEACVNEPFDNNVYHPRLLSDVMSEGDRKPRLPGDHQDLRAIALKVREDQIPRILPSELATNHWRGRLGRVLTLDKVVNRSPAIRQHHATQRPELEHRILIVFLMGVTAHQAAGTTDPAETAAKALGFSLLVNAALKVPHGGIEADVAWFQRDDANSHTFQWATQFRLAALRPTAFEGERWRNVVETDRRLPKLFVTAGGGVRLEGLYAMSEYSLVREHPADYLARACQGKYHGVFLVGIAPPGEASSLVPAPSLALPSLPAGVPPILLVTAGPEGRAGLRGATFSSLLAARMAPAALPPPPPDVDPALFFVQEFLQMIVGPIAREARVNRPRSQGVFS